mmetsp:Transcript_51366/g.155599  ORF Transcript_51366/g.155599 Transcript_51366/m.155599 type:complete len:255 (+) Transcript_51366:31-795(+)
MISDRDPVALCRLVGQLRVLLLLLLLLAPLGLLHLHLPLGQAHEEHARDNGKDPVHRVGEELEGRRLVLPPQQRPHQHEEAVGLVVAAPRRVEDAAVDPLPLRLGGPGAEGAELLPLVHGGAEEAGRNEEQEDGRDAHEPVHPHLLGALEEDAAHDACEHKRQADRQRQGAKVLEVADNPHKEDDGLQALAQAGDEGQGEEGVLLAEWQVPLLRPASGAQGLRELLPHLALVALLRVDHLVEVERQEGEHQGGD